MQTDINKICRTCLASSNDITLKSIFSGRYNTTLLYSDMLMSISSVKISPNDGLPTQICSKCIDKTMKAYAFKIECEKAEKFLLDKIPKVPIETTDSSSTVEIEKKTLKCDLCNISYYYKSSLTKHMHAKHAENTINENHSKIDPEKIFKCDLCQCVVANEDTLKRHIASKHRNKEKQNDVCEDKEESNLPIMCSFCKCIFTNEDHLRMHLVAKHLIQDTETAESNTCHFCGIETKYIKSHLAEHYKHLYCTKCKIKFDSVNSFEVHMNQGAHSNDDAFLCSTCGKKFSQLSNLKIHSLTHSGHKPYCCDTCNKSFSAPSTLKLHMRTHTNQRPYVCNMCGQGFKQSNDLTAHKRLHFGDLPHECKICHKRFNTTGKLNNHVRTHTCEKPYHCNICQKSFAESGTLKRHLLVHTGQKPHICSICGKGFTQSGSLGTHLKTHHIV